MTRLSRFLLAAAVISAATIIAATHPQWGRLTSIALLFLLLAALIAAGIFALRSHGTERRSSAKNLSPTLATLSSAAILAVYAAGYHKTSTAGGGFAEGSNRRDISPPVAIAAAAPISSRDQIEPAGEALAPSKLTTRSTKSETTNRPTKSGHGSASAATSGASAAVDYAASAPVAPQPRESGNESAAAAVAPQLAITGTDAIIPATASIAPTPPQPKALYKDGTYYGWGSCRHGDIQASVTIHDGKIAATAITQCLTRYSCSWIADLPSQVVKRQSPEVDYVSGASQSTDAFYGAIVAALSKAKN